MVDPAQRAWVARVLGLTPSAASGPSKTLLDAADGWQAASETVDRQIGALQAALRNRDDPELDDIAEYGLNAATGGFKVKLTAALMGARQGVKGDVAKLPALIAGLRAQLQDERIEACDENDFGVTVRIRDTLSPALDRLQAAVG